MAIEKLTPLRTFDFRQTPTSVNAQLSFTRETEASYYGSDGFLHFATNGQNWLAYSQQMDTKSWKKVGSEISIPGNIKDAAGSSDANKMTETEDQGEHRLSQELTVRQGIPLTISIYVKAGTRNKVRFCFSNSSTYTGGNPGVQFDLREGKFLSNSSNVVSYKAIKGNDDWWRLQVTGIPDRGTKSGLRIYILNENNALTYEGNEKNYIYVWGAQFEQGAKLSTYTPTALAPYMGLRYNYDLSSAPVLEGILIEPEGTNLILYSQKLDHTYWRMQDTSVVGSSSRSPEGKANAFKIREGSGLSAHTIEPEAGIVTVKGSSYTFSAFLKAAERRWVYFNINGAVVHFDLKNGQVGNTNFAYTDAHVENAGNGWYRCSASLAAMSSLMTTKIGVEQESPVQVYIGDGNSGILAYGIQLEKSVQLTSYIRTNGSPAYRAADIVTIVNDSDEELHDVFIQRKDGGAWVDERSGALNVSTSHSAVQVINFYDPQQSIKMKEDTTQSLFPHEYRYLGDNGTALTIMDKLFFTQTASKSWSIQKAVNKSSPVFKVQVKSGDEWPGDADGSRKKERAELYLKNANLPYDKDVWLSYAIKITPGDPLVLNSNEVCFLGQFHASEDVDDVSVSPVLAFRLEGEDTVKVYTCSTTQNPHYQGPPPIFRGESSFKRGIWHRIVVRVRFSPTNGQLQWWKNGEQMLNLSNIGIGFPDIAGPYWKFGIYRTSMKSTLTAEYANMEISTTSSLRSRVETPLIIA